MKRWVRWSLVVLMPVVLYLGGYVGCCLFPVQRPLMASGSDAGRGLREIYKPLLGFHESVVMERARERLSGKWTSGVGGELEFRLTEEGELMARVASGREGAVLGVAQWVDGTGMVGIGKLMIPRDWSWKFELVDGGRVRLYEAGEWDAAVAEEFVRPK